MDSRSRRIVRMAIGVSNGLSENDVETDEASDLPIEESQNCIAAQMNDVLYDGEPDEASDLDESQKCIASQMNEIISDVFSENEPDYVSESDQELSPFRISPRRISESYRELSPLRNSPGRILEANQEPPRLCISSRRVSESDRELSPLRNSPGRILEANQEPPLLCISSRRVSESDRELSPLRKSPGRILEPNQEPPPLCISSRRVSESDRELSPLRNSPGRILEANQEPPPLCISSRRVSESDRELSPLRNLLGRIVKTNQEPLSLPISSRRVSETTTESDSESDKSLFGGDFSDDDPSYYPETPKSSCRRFDNETDLITLEDLLGPNNACESVADFTLEPQPSTSHQREEVINDINTEIATPILTDILELVWSQVKTLSRWRAPNPASWKKNVAKKRRAEGLSYITQNQIRAAKVPKTIDCSKCMYKCQDFFPEQDRERICRTYWNLDFLGKKNYILSHVTVQPPKRVNVARQRAIRPFTTKCYFDTDSEKKQVCQKYFCSTLNISASVLNDAVKHRNELGFYSSEDHRGHHVPPNKTSPEKIQEVVDHIASFPAMEGHYVRKKSKRKYLDPTLSINKMYALYLEKHKENNPVSEITYRRIFATHFNISFFVPKKDQCLMCNKYASAQGQNKIDLKIAYQEHIQRKVTCEAEKVKDKQRAETDESFKSVSFDLQAILQIPCSKVGLIYYLRKLTIYNLTIYESALPNNAFCFPWSEVHGKKGSAEIGTILYHYLSNCISSDVTSVSLFSDTCSGQNRNQYVAAMLLWAVNKIDNLQVIEQKFLESGHSYMEVDSMHSSIESAKKNKDVYSMTDWINIFKSARSKGAYKVGNKKVKKDPYHVKEFKHNEFFDLKQLAGTIMKNKTKDCEGNKVNWLKIKKLKYVKGDPKIYFNYDVSEVYLNFDTRAVPTLSTPATPQSGTRFSARRRQKSNPNSVEPPPTLDDGFTLPELRKLYTKPLSISVAKKKDLVTLCNQGVIPEEYHGWYRSLNCETIVDRVPDVAASESSSDEEE